MRRNWIFPRDPIEHSMFRRITNTATMHKLVTGITDVGMAFAGVIPLLGIIIIVLGTRANLGITIWMRRDGSIRSQILMCEESLSTIANRIRPGSG